MNSLHISTSNSKTSQNSVLRYRFTSPMELDGYIALSNITLWYNWKNITAAEGNNTFSYLKGSSDSVDITLPDGSYSVEDLNDYLHFVMKQKDHDDEATDPDGNGEYAINLYANPVYNRVSLTILDGWKIRFRAGLAKTLGASEGSFSRSINFPRVPQLENVKSVQVHCNLVSNHYQSDSSLLYNFTPDNSYGSLLSIEPRFPQWRKTRHTEESEVEVWLTDQNSKILALEDDWGVILQIADKDLIRV